MGSDGQCSTRPCTDDCETEGYTECFGDSGYRVCGQYDSDTCLDWSSSVPCGADRRCQDGACIEFCQNACSQNEVGCVQNDDSKSWFCSDEDGDGCPEPTPVILHFVDEEGNPIPQVDSRLGDVSGQGELNASLEPGSYPVTVTSREYEDLQDTLQVPAGPPVERTYTLALVPPGTLVVAVTGPDGEPVPATVTVNGQAVAMEGELRQPRKQGPVKLAIQAEGYLSRQIQDEVRPGEETVIQVQLEKELVAVEKERIDLKDSVYFETARDVIKQESYTLLEQVATVMADHPEILLLRIEGHTDSRGDDAYNLDLSKRRAAAVKAFLVEKGVEEARLQSEGYGETRPLDPAENTAAWTKNRRVDFFIAQRSDEEE